MYMYFYICTYVIPLRRRSSLENIYIHLCGTGEVFIHTYTPIYSAGEVFIYTYLAPEKYYIHRLSQYTLSQAISMQKPCEKEMPSERGCGGNTRHVLSL